MNAQADATVRLRVLLAAFALLFVVLAAQLVRMQVIDPPLPPEFTDGAAPRVLHTEPARGLIVDRHGVVLAHNTPEFRVAVVPGELPDNEHARRSALVQLEALIGVPYAELEAAASSHLARVDPHVPVTVESGLGQEEAIALRAALAGRPYVRVDSVPARRYEPHGALAHILGHVGAILPDEIETWVEAGYPYDGQVGLGGVEQQYQGELRGESGVRLVLADPTGRELEVLGALDPEPGVDVVLAIDLELQRAAEEALARGIQAGLSTYRGGVDGSDPSPGGAAVVMDVRTGELLALVSLPTYDPNLFDGSADEATVEAVLTDPGRPLIDRTYMEIRPPGSIFKPLVAYAALEEEVARPGTLITSTGEIRIEDRYEPDTYHVLRDWAAHGTLDLYGAMARSSDVYFYYLAGGYHERGHEPFDGLGIDRLAEWTRAFGLGRPTGIDLPGEAPGIVPDPAWKDEVVGEPWYLGDTYTFGIGQSYLRVTPLQMAVATAAIANGGELLAPRVVAGVREGDRIRSKPREVTGRLPGDEEHLAIVRETMYVAAHGESGTARGASPDAMTIGGKTGTAEFGLPYYDLEYDTHGWYTAFAPYDEPEIAVVVMLEYGSGGFHAAPVVREILEAYVELQEAREGVPAGDRAARP